MSSVKMNILTTPLMLVWLGVMMVLYKVLTHVFVLSDLFTAGLFLLSIIACVVLTISGYRRLGYILLKPANAREKTLRIIRRIVKRNGGHFDTGIYVIHCDDSFWREIVELCLTYASVVVIDVTELSPNVIWALETAFSLMTPECVVLACGVCEGAPKEVPAPVRERLLVHLPGSAFARAQTFFYPLQRGQLEQHPWGGRRNLLTELETRVALAIAIHMRWTVRELPGAISE